MSSLYIEMKNHVFCPFQKRGEISVKGKGIMTTYWVLGKGVSASQVISPGPIPAGVPQSQIASLSRQTSHHSSLAAVVFGMIQANKRNTNINTSTRKCFLFNPFLSHLFNR